MSDALEVGSGARQFLGALWIERDLLVVADVECVVDRDVRSLKRRIFVGLPIKLCAEGPCLHRLHGAHYLPERSSKLHAAKNLGGIGQAED